MEITLLGGGNAIGASSALVAIGAHRILVDCGVRMTGDNVLPDCGLLAARGLPAVDAVVQTHAHFDHSGALPIFPQQSPATPAYMTPPQALISILLQDALRIAKRQCDAEGDLPPFPPAAVGIEGNDHGKTVRMLFSGDLAVGNQLIVPGMPVPSTDWRKSCTRLNAVCRMISKQTRGTLSAVRSTSAFRRPDGLVIESTYGNQLHSPRQAEEQRLLQWLASILKRQGKVLIPAYALVVAQRARNASAIAGYQDEESPGQRLLDLATGRGDSLSIGSRGVAVPCDVTAYALSAHADADELTRLIDNINPRAAVLVHGAGAAREAARPHHAGGTLPNDMWEEGRTWG